MNKKQRILNIRDLETNFEFERQKEKTHKNKVMI